VYPFRQQAARTRFRNGDELFEADDEFGMSGGKWHPQLGWFGVCWLGVHRRNPHGVDT
jgi:hypothetical protein